jgi:hypothetical protein
MKMMLTKYLKHDLLLPAFFLCISI